MIRFRFTFPTAKSPDCLLWSANGIFLLDPPLHHLDPFPLQNLPDGIAHVLLVRRKNAGGVECWTAVQQQLGCNAASDADRQ